MSVEAVTSLPTVAAALQTDIIYAVQGGNSVKETLQQVSALQLSYIILHNAGSPNGSLAGSIYQLCWDTVNNILFICTSTGSSSTAVWSQITPSGAGIPWTNVTSTSASMSPDHGYMSNNVGLVTLTLPTVCGFGQIIQVMGLGAGGWKIAQNAGQQIIIGDASSTSGNGGYIASTQQNDSIYLSCVTANLVWSVIGAPQGEIDLV